MKKNVLIVGAGPGGCMTANCLAKSMREPVEGMEQFIEMVTLFQEKWMADDKRWA